MIQTGPVSLGKDAFVGEATVLDIGTSMGDGAQLGHTSSLHSGQAVPAGEHWHGSPAERTEVDYRTVAHAPRRGAAEPSSPPCSWRTCCWCPCRWRSRRCACCSSRSRCRPAGGLGLAAFPTWDFYRECLVASAVLFFGFALVGLVFVVMVPRLLNLIIAPGRVYRLYGFHYWVHRLIVRLTNRKFYTRAVR